MGVEPLFESVPNFSEGRRSGVVDAIAAAAAPAHLLDVCMDGDHNRAVISVAGSRAHLVDGLLGAVTEAAARIDLRMHAGLHPRVGVADVVPIVPLAHATMDECVELARDLAGRIWRDLAIPVYLYGYGARTLADIRGGQATPDVGGPAPHPTAGAVCVGARQLLVAFNVMLPGVDLPAARAIARSLRESGGGIRGVMALAFAYPDGRIQLSMNLFRLDETRPADVVAELERRGVAVGEQELVGLSPARAAGPEADGRLLEARLASAAARSAAAGLDARAGEEAAALASKLEREAEGLAGLAADQESILAGGERAAALRYVLRAASIEDPELDAMLAAAAAGFRAALTVETEARYAKRVEALEARLVESP